MKQFLSVALVLFLALAVLASCFHMTSSGNASQVAPTQTYTAPILATSSAAAPMIETALPLLFYDLNMAIENMETSTKFNQLEHITGASYQVVGIDFPQDNSSLIFRIKTRCECAQNAQCCSPIRTFVVTLMAMDSSNYNTDITKNVQSAGTVSTMQVWCYDHANLTDVLSVPWTDVTEFLKGNLTGFQLASKVTPQPH